MGIEVCAGIGTGSDMVEYGKVWYGLKPPWHNPAWVALGPERASIIMDIDIPDDDPYYTRTSTR